MEVKTAKVKRHLYNTKIGRIQGFIRRFGLRELLMKPARTLFAPIILLFKEKRGFTFGDKAYRQFYHRYNMTWVTERGIEIPIIRNYINQAKNQGERMLEVGNVMPHYYKADWDVLDKFEKGRGVINRDIADFRPHKKYGLIVSISTFEHIGYDDESTTNSGDKIKKAFNNLKENCLKAGGTAVITVPLGYNPEMDGLIFANWFGFRCLRFMKRISKKDWKEVPINEARGARYSKPFPYANFVAFGEYSA